jgi:hypothetical protein
VIKKAQQPHAFWVPIDNQTERDRVLAVGNRSGYKVGFTKDEKYYRVTWTVRK